MFCLGADHCYGGCQKTLYDILYQNNLRTIAIVVVEKRFFDQISKQSDTTNKMTAKIQMLISATLLDMQ